MTTVTGTARSIQRWGLTAMAVATGVVGLWALAAPLGFYESFPWPGRNWVSMLPPYNEHVLRDFGGLNLGFGVMFTVAAVRPERLLSATLLVGYLCFAVPHLGFHVFHLHGFSAFDAVGQVVTLAGLVVLPLFLLAVLRPPRGRRTAG